MAVTQTSTMQPQNHRELIVFTDMYGATSRLYVYASQAANRATLIAARLTIAQNNEAAMTALLAAAAPAPAVTTATAAATTTAAVSTTTGSK
jgi:hypothetical protein